LAWFAESPVPRLSVPLAWFAEALCHDRRCAVDCRPSWLALAGSFVPVNADVLRCTNLDKVALDPCAAIVTADLR
jgi:hypothetical protein